MNTKFELTTETRNGLFRIRSKIAFGIVVAGELGGFVEKESNLSVSGNAWVFGNAQVSGNARVFGNAWVSGDAWVFGNAQVSGNARVFGDAWVFGNAQVSGNARVSGNAWVFGNAQVSGNARVFGNAWVSGDARVSGNAHCLIVGPIGSRHAFLTIHADAKIKVRFTTGCFSGSRAQFVAALRKTHKIKTFYRKQYDAALAMAKLVRAE